MVETFEVISTTDSSPIQTNVRSAPASTDITSKTTVIQIASEMVDPAPFPSNSYLADASSVIPPESVRADLLKYFPIFEGTWTASTPRGQTLVMMDPFYLLMAKDYIRSRIAGYAYIRADVEIIVSVTSGNSQYGNIMVTHLSDYDPTDTQAYHVSHYVTRSRNHAVILSVSKGSTSPITLPDVYPWTWRRVEFINEFEHTCVNIDVFDPLKNISTTPNDSCTFRVDARLTNVKLSAYSPDIAPPAIVPAYASAISLRKATATRAAQKAFTLGLTSQSSEAIAKAENPLIAGISETISTIAGVIGPVAKIASSLAPLAVFDKPATDTPVSRTVTDFNADLVYGRGTFPFNSLTMSPQTGLSTDGAPMAEMNPAPSCLDVASQFSLVKHSEFTAATATNVLHFPLAVDPAHCPVINTITVGSITTTVYCPTYLSVISSMFAYTRVNMKYLIRFTTSPLLVAKIRILYFPQGVPAGNVSTYAGATISRVIEVAGDMDYMFSIPYEHYMPMLETTDPITSYAPGVLYLALESPIAYNQAGTSPTVYVSWWQAADEGSIFTDFVSVPASYYAADRSYSVDASLPLTSQTSIDALSGKKNVPGLVVTSPTSMHNIVTDEPQFGLLTLMHRLSRAGHSTTGVGYPLSQVPNVDNVVASHFNLILRMFQRYRGGTVYYMRNPGQSMQFFRTWYANGDEDKIAMGQVQAYTDREPHLGVVYPYVHRDSYYSRITNRSNGPPLIHASSSTSTPLYIAASDDFTLGGLCCPPLWYYYVVAPSPSPSQSSDPNISSKGL